MEEDLIKQTFIKEVLEADIKKIYNAQLDIARERIYVKGKSLTRVQGYGSLVQGRSGALMAALQSPSFSIQPSGKGVVAVSNVPLYIRFLDMKGKGNFAIYNRQIWGILYNNALQKIQFGYGKEVRERIYKELQDAFPEHTG